MYPLFLCNRVVCSIYMGEDKKLILEEGWNKLLTKEFNKPYFLALQDFLEQELKKGVQIYPPKQDWFKAFNLCVLNEVKVIILGQDPYHNPGQAMGLSFSVPDTAKVPPSLQNVYKELQSDLGVERALHGDLTQWAEQGVLLLNAMLTVEHKKPGSHRKIGWHVFTDAIIQMLSDHKNGLVFMLWGNFAKAKKDLINQEKHLILEAAHPSPLARGAYFGSRHFSKANAYLISKKKTAINWQFSIR